MPSTTTGAGGSGRGVVVFRVDSSLEIGTGHVMRCLTLADELCRNDIRPVFICRSFVGNLRREIERRGYDLLTLQSADTVGGGSGNTSYNQWLGSSQERDAQETIHAITALGVTPDWLVVDHYGIDNRWERMIQPVVGHILVIDDLADRPHECDMLLDQNLYDRFSDRYDYLLPAECVRLLGPQYALLRDEFRRARATLRSRSGEIRRLLVFFGGVDRADLTARALTAIDGLIDRKFTADVVIGGGNPHLNEIEQMAGRMKQVSVHVETNEMARLMAQADLSVGAGGTTTWERAYLGLPSIAVVVAENQREMTDAAARAGACHNLGWYEQVSVDTISLAMREACASPQLMRKMSRQATSISAPDHQTGTGEVAARLVASIRVHI